MADKAKIRSIKEAVAVALGGSRLLRTEGSTKSRVFIFDCTPKQAQELIDAMWERHPTASILDTIDTYNRLRRRARDGTER